MGSSKCNCRFIVTDVDYNGNMMCGLDALHEGPHIDIERGYTWGPLTGLDDYRLKQVQMVEVAKKRRENSFKNFLRKRRG